VAAIRPIALRFSARARLQLLSIHEYIDQRNPAAAARVGAGIREAAEVLRYFPYSGRPGRASGTREWVVRRLPYVLVYEIDIGDEGVTILGVFHCAQQRD
jgi:plasmid stabilization system protein ParE